MLRELYIHFLFWLEARTGFCRQVLLVFNPVWRRFVGFGVSDSFACGGLGFEALGSGITLLETGFACAEFGHNMLWGV